MRKVFGTGETILDIIFRNDQPQKVVPGGSISNGSISLGRLNVPVSFISELGNDRVGDIIWGFVEDNHIMIEFVDRFPDGKSPISLASLDDDKNANYIFYKDYPAQRLEVPLPKVEKDDTFMFGSYYSLNPVLRIRMAEFLQHAQERKAIIYYDPNLRKARAHKVIRLTPIVLENLEFADIVRGSDEGFQNLYGKSDAQEVYKGHIQFHCDRFLTTHGTNGVNLHTRNFTRHFDSSQVQPLSTIGADDNFNAGIIYGPLKYDVRHVDLPSLDQDIWGKVIRCGMDLASEVYQSYDNCISKEFTAKYISQL